MEPGQQPNKRLRLQRKLRGWSQEDVAAGLHRLAASLGEPEPGVDATMVSRWERGTRKPRPRYVRLLCALFELSAEQLAIVDDVDDPPVLAHRARGAAEDDEVQGRDFLRRLASLLGVASLPPTFEPQSPEPWERLSRALHQPGRVDLETVRHLEQVTFALESLGPTQVSAAAIFGPATGHLDAITMLLQGSPPPDLRRRLCSLAAETAGFAAWLRWEMDDHQGTAVYFRTAIEAAREARDAALVAYLRGSAACQPPHREMPERRIQCLRSIDRGDATPSARVWLAAKEADAFALMGRRDDCLRALERAEHFLHGQRTEQPGSRRPRFTAVDRMWLEGERGASLAKLGATELAREILEPVVAALGPTSERDRLWLMTSLASAYARDGEPEEACRLARATLSRAFTMQLTPVVELVRGLRRDLQRFSGSRAVRELDEHLRSVTGVRPPAVASTRLAG